MNTKAFLALLFLPALALVGCGGGESTEGDEPASEDALELSPEQSRLAKFAMASGVVATREDATALRKAIDVAGGVHPWPGVNPEVVSGLMLRDFPGFEANDWRAFGITCQEAGKDLPGYGPLSIDTCTLSAVVEVDAQKKNLLGKLKSADNEAYEAHLTGKIAAAVAKTAKGSRAIECRGEGASATCTVQVERGDLRDFAPILKSNDGLSQMKRAELTKFVDAMYPRE